MPDAEGPESIGELQLEQIRQPAGEGSVTVYQPPIGKLLPVYVEDPYEGFEVRLPRLTDQRSTYVDRTCRRRGGRVGRDRRPDAALANHLIMGPVIPRPGRVWPYAIKNHGPTSSTRPPNPRFIPRAGERNPQRRSRSVRYPHGGPRWEGAARSRPRGKTGFGPARCRHAGVRPLKPASMRAGSALRNEIANEPPSTTFGRDADAAVAALDAFAAAEGPGDSSAS